MADNLSIDSTHHHHQQQQQQLYYSIRLNNSDNTLNAWMRHILSYLSNSMAAAAATAANENMVVNIIDHNEELFGRNENLQEPHISRSAVCNGSSDCQSNVWVHEVSYEQHYRKLLMSRINAGDTDRVNSVDQESLRREASLVMESVDATRSQTRTGAALDRNQNTAMVAAAAGGTPMDIESVSEHSSRYSDWDFVMYDSDADVDAESTDDSSDPTYEVSESDLIKLNDGYTSASDSDDDDTYEIISSDSLIFDDDDATDTTDTDSDFYSSDSSSRTLKYRRISRNSETDANMSAKANANAANSVTGSVFDYYYGTSEDEEDDLDLEYVRSESEWDASSTSN